MAKIIFSDVLRKHLTIVSYLLVSGVLGWVLAVHVVGTEALVAIFAPAINYIIYSVKKELDNEGVIEAFRN